MGHMYRASPVWMTLCVCWIRGLPGSHREVISRTMCVSSTVVVVVVLSICGVLVRMEDMNDIPRVGF
ncbi:hypothetical protein Micbo1qcDRAFT_161022 [Microdochium bolleyi]|uniref:Uncharacterized protein n=1 Tax=Microdochium bolleyi TaxID=196109 RepID=A0A136J7I5_9PEZI|nr:hypothetical protein Micbo1qcDRAFT_161022 [Microdochium bolleyi]